MKQKNHPSKLFITLVLLITYLPVVAVVVSSFNASKIPSFWQGFSLRWYKQMFGDKDLLQSLLNSIILAASASLIAAVLGTFSAIILNNSNSSLKKTVNTLIILPLIIPEIILGMVFMAFYDFIRLPAGFATLIVSHATFCVPYVMIVVSSRLVGFDKNQVEAARDLGAGPLRAFFTVELPFLMPAVLTGSLLAFAMSFDDVIISVFVTGPKVSTLPLKVYTSMKTSMTPEINALGSVILLVSTIALAVFLAMEKRKTNEKVH